MDSDKRQIYDKLWDGCDECSGMELPCDKCFENFKKEITNIKYTVVEDKHASHKPTS